MKSHLKHIRFGVICNNNQLYTWQEIVIKKLISEADVELKLVVYDGKRQGKKPAPSSFNDSSHKIGFLWNLYYRLFIKKKSKALQRVETLSLFEGIAVMQCDFLITYGFAQLHSADIQIIENAELDFILDFSSVQFTGNLLKVVKYGIWNYRFGNLEKYQDTTGCFWEIYHKDVITSAYLIRLTNKPDTNCVLKEGHLKTAIFYTENIDKIHLEATDWPLKICQDIRNNNVNNSAVATKIKSDKIYRSPSNFQMLFFFYVQFNLAFKSIIKLLFYTDFWNIGVAEAPIHDFLDSKKTPTIHWFPNLPKSRFMADPFGIHFKNQLHIIYEDYRFDQGIGKTASILYHDGEFKDNKIVIDEEFHMSYPYLLDYEDEIYCIPETYQANQVRLYKALEFPLKWKLEKVLIENYAGIDSTPFKHNNTWFLFSTNKKLGARYNLNIHYSDSIFGPWHQHPKNPVKTDIRSSRPAGTLFIHNGDLFRPSMDYSEKIEGRISINKVITLTINDFKEEIHNIVDPFKKTYFSDKVHTLSQVGNYTLVDGAKELFILANFNALKHKIMRIFVMLKNK
ncbi:glucosamine inositolphosphorylceramide transferase family protein [Maribacter arenosus]|uniref:Glucosamine inositolphosphorylceramide transferase 1 N-terminal domain-containing protein n=1 Tax=Maribacter arenosus TaxID=1854708 RepID=A0ABR7VGX2_9FLAO|nr:hypothetical protein [Maribacter arenosus]MBD0852591.1 hypothetical protein [Maribacter arenosus]